MIMTFQALHYKKYSTASDVWSYGALMYEIWSVGHKPFEEHDNNEVSFNKDLLGFYCYALGDGTAGVRVSPSPSPWLSSHNL